MKQETNIERLLSAFFAGTLSEKEYDELARLVADGRHSEQVQEWLRRAWENASPQETDVPSEEMYARIMADINAKRLASKHRLRIITFTALRYAAVVAAAFGLFQLWHTYGGGDDVQRAVAYNEITAPYGSKAMITLSDNTKVWLNAGTQLKYPTTFGGDLREVFLQGEGYFEVAEDKRHPFVVNTDKMGIKVLGTKFNVMANADDSNIEATLLEGVIEVMPATHSGAEELTLKPGEKITLRKDTDTYRVDALTATDMNKAAAWKDNKLIFTDERFADAKVRLERWYGVSIHVSDPEILNYRFTGTFENQTLEQAITAFGRAAAWHFTIDKNQVILSKR
jgi:ferric-dicitrate binding protein FerR (iron transport regulator)